MKPKFKIMMFKVKKPNSLLFQNIKLEEGWHILRDVKGMAKEFNSLEEAHQEIINIITNENISISNLKIIQEYPFEVRIDSNYELCTEAVGEVYCNNCGECETPENKKPLKDSPCFGCKTDTCDGCKHDINSEQLLELEEDCEQDCKNCDAADCDDRKEDFNKKYTKKTKHKDG